MSQSAHAESKAVSTTLSFERSRGVFRAPYHGGLCTALRQLTHVSRFQAFTIKYGGCPGDSIGFSVRYQGELLGLRDPQNRDLRRKSPPETEKSVG